VGFRGYIGEFLGAILMFFRPSLPSCFPIREVPLNRSGRSRSSSSRRKPEEKVVSAAAAAAAAAAGGNRRKK